MRTFCFEKVVDEFAELKKAVQDEELGFKPKLKSAFSAELTSVKIQY